MRVCVHVCVFVCEPPRLSRPPRAPPDTAHASLPLPQQLLGFPAGGRPKDSDINTSYESLENTPLPDGYSSELCRNRAELLGVVKASLFQSKVPARLAWLLAPPGPRDTPDCGRWMWLQQCIFQS